MRRTIAIGILAALGGCATGVMRKAPTESAAQGLAYAADAAGTDARGLGGAAGLVAPAAARTPPSPAPASQETAGAVPPGSRRLMIYRGRYEILVGNVEDAVERFLSMVLAEGGYLERREDGDVTCRVPAERYFGLLERIEALGRVLSKSLESEDVTRKVMDLEIRLENARESRARLLDLLSRATDTEAILEIERELRRLTDEIEQMEAQLTWLRDQIAFSTIRVVFRAQAPDVRPPSRRRETLFPWIDRIGIERVLEGF